MAAVIGYMVITAKTLPAGVSPADFIIVFCMYLFKSVSKFYVLLVLIDRAAHRRILISVYAVPYLCFRCGKKNTTVCLFKV